MRVLVDADGCPVVDITIRITKGHGCQCFLLCDSAHYLDREDATTLTVSIGKDSVDHVLANMLQPGDIVVTADYGLAALCLAKRARPISPDGLLYTDENIGGLLEQRHLAQQIRRAGERLSSMPKRTEAQNTAFGAALSKLLGESSK